MSAGTVTDVVADAVALPRESASMPASISVEEMERIGEALDAARATTTRRAYASRWAAWERWCATRGDTPEPPDPTLVAVWVTELAAAGRSMSTIDQSLAAIADRCVAAGLPSPTAHPGVMRARVGLARKLGRAPRRQAHPLAPDEIRQMVETCDSDGVRGTRDRALLLVGFAGALRRSEIAALRDGDVRRQRNGLVVSVRRSKSDQEGEGVVVGIPRGKHELTCPVRAWRAWRDLIEPDGDSPAFCAITKANTIPLTLRPISGRAVETIIQRRAEQTGLGDLPISGHSLRAGHATTAAEHGADAAKIARTTRHEKIETLQRYIRPAEVLRDTSARYLGL